MEINQKQRQEQHLAMTPEMLTSIAILQLSGTSLIDFLTEEAQSNPALDSDEAIRQTERMSEAMELVRLTPFMDRQSTPLSGEPHEYSGDLPIAAQTTFSEYLLEQIHLMKLSKAVRDACILIVESLDEWGYLRIEDEISLKQLPAFEAALEIVQSLEPYGVGARNLAESMIIQLRSRGIKDPTLEKLLSSDLELLASGQFEVINERYGLKDSKAVLDLVRTLNPRPASGFGEESTPFYVIPDLTFSVDKDEITVSLNEALSPKISVSSHYLSMLKNLDPDQRVLYRQYVKRLSGIIEALEKRNQTLMKIGERIAFYQKDLLLGKTAYRKPLRMSQIAKETGLNVSTISRAVRDKYADVNGRILPLRIFFSSGFQVSGQAYSRQEILDRILQLIQEEDRDHPLSDQKLTDILSSAGIPIKRRTVAKLREELAIPPSFRRNKK